MTDIIWTRFIKLSDDHHDPTKQQVDDETEKMMITQQNSKKQHPLQQTYGWLVGGTSGKFTTEKRSGWIKGHTLVLSWTIHTMDQYLPQTWGIGIVDQ